MKKTAALFLALLLTLSGCAVQNGGAPGSPIKADLIDEIEEESDMTDGTEAETEAETEAPAETSSVTASSSSATDPFENIGIKANLCFGYTYEGEFEPIDYEEYISEEYVEYSMKPYTGEKYSRYGMFIEVYYFNNDKDENYDNSAAAKRGFEFFAEKLSENGIVPVEGRKHEIIEVHIYKQGDILYVTAIFEETNGSEPIFFLEDEPVSLYGEDDKQIDDLEKAMPWCKIEVSSPEAKSLATVYIGDVRIDTLDGDDYWNKILYVKNCGEKPVENLPEFLLQNGFTDGCEEMYISYPEHDGIEYSQVVERLQITDKGIITTILRCF